jgi:hypothetical protein
MLNKIDHEIEHDENVTRDDYHSCEIPSDR